MRLLGGSLRVLENKNKNQKDPKVRRDTTALLLLHKVLAVQFSLDIWPTIMLTSCCSCVGFLHSSDSTVVVGKTKGAESVKQTTRKHLADVLLSLPRWFFPFTDSGFNVSPNIGNETMMFLL